MQLSVVIGDKAAEKNGGDKVCLARRGPPVFSTLIENCQGIASAWENCLGKANWVILAKFHLPTSCCCTLRMQLARPYKCGRVCGLSSGAGEYASTKSCQDCRDTGEHDICARSI
eukprot:1154572-Pelagomonas_calceolata.AAC.2